MGMEFVVVSVGNLIGLAQDAAGAIYLDASATGLKGKVVRIPV